MGLFKRLFGNATAAPQAAKADDLAGSILEAAARASAAFIGANPQISTRNSLALRHTVAFEFIYFLLHMMDRAAHTKLPASALTRFTPHLAMTTFSYAVRAETPSISDADGVHQVQQYFEQFVAATDLYAKLRVTPIQTSEAPTGTVLYECGRRVAAAVGEKANAIVIANGAAAAASALRAVDPARRVSEMKV